MIFKGPNTFNGPYKLKAGQAPMKGYVEKTISYRMAYPDKKAPKKAGPVKPPLGTAHKAKAASVAPVKKKAASVAPKKKAASVAPVKKKARKNIIPNAHPWDEYGP